MTRGDRGDGTGPTDAKEASTEMSAWDVLPSEDIPVAEGVAETRRMLGTRGWGGVAVEGDIGRDNSGNVLRIICYLVAREMKI